MGGSLEKSVESKRPSLVSTTGWSEVLSCCTTLKRSRCALAWCLAHGCNITELHDTVFQVRDFFTPGMKHRVARKRAIFPLHEGDFASALRLFASVNLTDSVTEDFTSLWSRTAWTMLSCYACQTLGHGHTPFLKGKWTALETRLVAAVEQTVNRMLSHGHAEVKDTEAVEKELKKRRVSYEGEEIGVCHCLSLEQILPALPPKQHGGSIDVLEYVSETTKHFLDNPEKLVVEDVGQQLPKLQGKIHVQGNEIKKIAAELVDRGVCTWIPWTQVAEFRKEKVLNGLFGVEKCGLVDGKKPILRLIMNLVPSNSILKQFKGFTKRLPHITSWLSTYVEHGEELRLWQSDMSNAFYLFRLPEKWQRFLAFNVVHKHCEIYGGDDQTLFCLACCVLPMGWGSSVSIMQEVSEKLLLGGNMPECSQVVRGKPLPKWMVGLLDESRTSGRAWWHIYLDNFAAGEIDKSGSTFLSGEIIHQEAERLWTAAGVVSAAKKRKSGEITGQELGAYLNGSERTMGPSPERMINLLLGTMALLSRRTLSRKLLQVIAGRWIHVFQYRRPAMSFLESTWEFISSKGTLLDLQYKVRRELFACMCGLPMMHTFLGAEISEVITASDASSFGGAVGIATHLSSEGEDFVKSNLRVDNPQPTGIMVLSLFHGIGGSFRAYDVLGIRPDALVAFDIHQPAMRITSRRWPHAELYGDVRQLNKAQLEQLLMRYPTVTELHVWGGFPCVDLSSVNVRGQGLDGPQSSLFYELKRVLKELKEIGHVKVKFIAENVASMPKHECERITEELQVKPYHLNCADAVPMQRPRLCWTSECLEGCLGGITFSEEQYWVTVSAPAAYPQQADWITEGAWWPGGDEGYTLPTALKSIERKRPPPAPAGIHRCDTDTLARWTSDSYRFPPYHYLPRFIFWTDDKWRLANSSEKELLLGYGFNHTKLCFSASKIKSSGQKYEDERLCLLGDSFSVFSFIIPAAALCKHLLPTLQYSQLVDRMGLAPGFTCSLRCTAPIRRRLQYGSSTIPRPVTTKSLNQILLSKTNHTGSDVRISTGEFLNPKAVVRQSIEASWWKWEHLFNYKWKLSEHINVLELRTILHAIRYHIMHLKACHLRVFHVTDSYICMSVISKGRTSSRQLSRVLKKVNALLLAFGIHCIISHVESTDNPTDEASRTVAMLPSKNTG